MSAEEFISSLSPDGAVVLGLMLFAVLGLAITRISGLVRDLQDWRERKRIERLRQYDK